MNTQNNLTTTAILTAPRSEAEAFISTATKADLQALLSLNDPNGIYSDEASLRENGTIPTLEELQGSFWNSYDEYVDEKLSEEKFPDLPQFNIYSSNAVREEAISNIMKVVDDGADDYDIANYISSLHFVNQHLYNKYVNDQNRQMINNLYILAQDEDKKFQEEKAKPKPLYFTGSYTTYQMLEQGFPTDLPEHVKAQIVDDNEPIDQVIVCNTTGVYITRYTTTSNKSLDHSYYTIACNLDILGTFDECVKFLRENL